MCLKEFIHKILSYFDHVQNSELARVWDELRKPTSRATKEFNKNSSSIFKIATAGVEEVSFKRHD